MAGDGDAIDLRVEVLILVVGENLTKEESESVKTAVQLNVSTGACSERRPTMGINLLVVRMRCTIYGQHVLLVLLNVTANFGLIDQPWSS